MLDLSVKLNKGAFKKEMELYLITFISSFEDWQKVKRQEPNYGGDISFMDWYKEYDEYLQSYLLRRTRGDLKDIDID